MKKGKLKDPRKRKMLLVLPLLIIPFLTMAFWALGGGKADAANHQNQTTGLNLQLPNAQLKDDKGENKLSYYEQAEKDSVKWKEGRENDPFYTAMSDSVPAKSFGYNPYPLQTGNYRDPNEQKVYQKLAELNGHLQNSSNYGDKRNQEVKYSSSANTSFSREDVDRLEDMMRTVSSPTSEDPEVDQLNGMMERILDIQHPERVKQRLNETRSNTKEQVFEVGDKKDHFSISLLDTDNTNKQPLNAFYGIDNKIDKSEDNAIEAVIHETQSLVDGSTVKMRLLSDITVDKTTIPIGNFVFGKASLQGERLYIDINSIRKDNCIYPIKLSVFDLDGMEGVHIPGTIERDVAKQSADNSVQNIEMNSIDPSFKAQATAAGLNTAKTLLAKKTKLVRVTVKAGYKILIKDKSSQ